MFTIPPVHDLIGQKALVMGLGRFGGGIGVSRYLHRCGARVLVTDMAQPDTLAQSMARLADLPIDYRLGEHRIQDFASADLVIVNPAVDPRNNPYLQAARQAGVRLTSEIRLTLEALPNRLRTIGITGTAGKSTTSSMIHHILSRSPSSRAWLGGNIGGSLLDVIDQITEDDWIVLELSSFMLEGLDQMHWSPHIAVITNFSDNHLDRHGTIESYRAAKQVILEHQRPEENDCCVMGPGVRDEFVSRVENCTSFDRREAWAVAPPINLLVPGDHNQLNARLASTAVRLATGTAEQKSWQLLRDFPGLPHRLQFVGEHRGVRYFNDSKSTTPPAALLAIDSFPDQTVHLILGGYDKGTDLTALAQYAQSHCAGIYTIGKTGPAIARALSDATNHRACLTLDRAVQTATGNARPGEVVVLSPACASWDQFENYEQRGEHFIQLVKKAMSDE